MSPRREWLDSSICPRLLALATARLHCYAHIWTRWVDCAPEGVRKKLARLAPGYHDTSPFLFKVAHELIVGLPFGTPDCCRGQVLLTHHVNIIGFDD